MHRRLPARIGIRQTSHGRLDAATTARRSRRARRQAEHRGPFSRPLGPPQSTHEGRAASRAIRAAIAHGLHRTARPIALPQSRQ